MSLWIADNATPFAVGRAFARDREGREVWVVAARATWQIERDGSLTLAPEQLPVSRAQVFQAETGSSSLLFESDFPFAKKATDVVVHAHAWAPGQRPAPYVDVALQLGPLRKQLRVHGARTWRKANGSAALSASRAEPFVTLPIAYEHAWGGADPQGQGHCALNPIGRGYANDPAQLEHSALPNVEDPREPLTNAESAPSKPAGFGAIPAHWQPRARYAGTYDARWQRERAPLWPEDFDPRFFQIAPEDQQTQGFLRGGELCDLHNLTVEGRLRFALPRIRIGTTTVFTDRQEERPADLHLVLIQPELRRLQLVWHMAIECHGREHTLRATRIRWEGDRIIRAKAASAH